MDKPQQNKKPSASFAVEVLERLGVHFFEPGDVVELDPAGPAYRALLDWCLNGRATPPFPWTVSHVHGMPWNLVEAAGHSQALDFTHHPRSAVGLFSAIHFRKVKP